MGDNGGKDLDVDASTSAGEGVEPVIGVAGDTGELDGVAGVRAGLGGGVTGVGGDTALEVAAGGVTGVAGDRCKDGGGVGILVGVVGNGGGVGAGMGGGGDNLSRAATSCCCNGDASAATGFERLLALSACFNAFSRPFCNNISSLTASSFMGVDGLPTFLRISRALLDT